MKTPSSGAQTGLYVLGAVVGLYLAGGFVFWQFTGLILRSVPAPAQALLSIVYAPFFKVLEMAGLL